MCIFNVQFTLTESQYWSQDKTDVQSLLTSIQHIVYLNMPSYSRIDGQEGKDNTQSMINVRKQSPQTNQ